MNERYRARFRASLRQRIESEMRYYLSFLPEFVVAVLFFLAILLLFPIIGAALM